MSQAYDSKAGAAALLDPLNEPEPSQETGLGTHFYPPEKKVPSVAASPASPTSSTNPFRKSSVDHKTHSRQTSREIPHHSPGGSPKPFPKYRDAAFGEGETRRRSGSGDHLPPAYNQTATGEPSQRRRGSSLRERFPGDNSHKPLDIIRRDSKKAYRSPHLNKRHLPGADIVDRLDGTGATGLPYHHEGPYDAASLARNSSFANSPIAAVADSNREALKATPAENIKDALDRHVPITGVASVPPGESDGMGRVYNYEEGTDMMREPNAPGGPYKQWAGVDYTRDDIGGKGEPSFSLDKALQAHTIHERDFDGHRGIELADQSGSSRRDGKRAEARDPVEIAGDDGRYADLHHDADVEGHISGHSDRHSSAQAHVSRTSSLRKAGEGLKKRLSIKQKYREIHNGEVPE